MPGTYEIEFLPERRTSKLAGSRGNYYESADGTRMNLVAEPIWCCGCNAVSEGERIESVAELDRQLADLRDPRSELYGLLAKDWLGEFKDLGEAFTQNHTVEREQRKRFRVQRVAPPKCIRCECTEIVPLPEGQSVPHPTGAGSIRCTSVGMCSTSFNNWFFTPEGDRIPRDTSPSDWHHPGLDNSPGAVMRWLNRKLGRPDRG